MLSTNSRLFITAEKQERMLALNPRAEKNVVVEEIPLAMQICKCQSQVQKGVRRSLESLILSLKLTHTSSSSELHIESFFYQSDIHSSTYHSVELNSAQQNSSKSNHFKL